jgi:hypothetical protein
MRSVVDQNVVMRRCKISYVMLLSALLNQSVDFVVVTGELVPIMLTHEDALCKQYLRVY